LKGRAAAALCLTASLAVAQPVPQKSGLDLASLDDTTARRTTCIATPTRAGCDEAEIPSDRVLYGTFVELEERVSADLRSLIEELQAAGTRRKGSAAQQIVDLYASLMDEARLESLGRAPLRPVLERIQSISSPRELAAAAAHLSTIGAGGLFPVELTSGSGAEARPIAQLSPGGFLLPEARSYLADDAASRELRARYETYLARIFEGIGRADAAGEARAVLMLETELARAQAAAPSAEAGRRYTLGELRRAMPDFDWMAWAEPQGLDRVAAIVLSAAVLLRALLGLTRALPLDGVEVVAGGSLRHRVGAVPERNILGRALRVLRPAALRPGAAAHALEARRVAGERLSRRRARAPVRRTPLLARDAGSSRDAGREPARGAATRAAAGPTG
jgi:hypothetical protein